MKIKSIYKKKKKNSRARTLLFTNPFIKKKRIKKNWQSSKASVFVCGGKRRLEKSRKGKQKRKAISARETKKQRRTPKKLKNYKKLKNENIYLKKKKIIFV